MRIVIFCPFVIDYISTDYCFVLVVIAPLGYRNTLIEQSTTVLNSIYCGLAV